MDPHRASQTPGAAQGDAGVRSSPRLLEMRNSATTTSGGSDRHPHSVSEQYRGLLQTTQSSLFSSPAAADALATLRRVATASLDRPSESDVSWMQVMGDLNASARLSFREITIPAPDLSPDCLGICKSSAAQSYVGPSPGQLLDGDYNTLRTAGAALGAAALDFLSCVPGMHAGLYFIGTQISSAPQRTKRSKHCDPAAIAAALATFSLEGTARIRMTHYSRGSGGSRAPFDIECNMEQVYMLTGERELWFARHEVVVTSPRRIGVTLRFGAPGHPPSHHS